MSVGIDRRQRHEAARGGESARVVDRLPGRIGVPEGRTDQRLGAMDIAFLDRDPCLAVRHRDDAAVDAQRFADAGKQEQRAETGAGPDGRGVVDPVERHRQRRPVARANPAAPPPSVSVTPPPSPMPANISGEAASQRCAVASTWSMTLRSMADDALPTAASIAAMLSILAMPVSSSGEEHVTLANDSQYAIVRPRSRPCRQGLSA